MHLRTAVGVASAVAAIASFVTPAVSAAAVTAQCDGPMVPVTVERGETIDLGLQYTNNSADFVTFTTYRRPNALWDGELVVHSLTLDPGFGAGVGTHLDTDTARAGTDTVHVEIVSSATGQTVLGTCIFTLTVTVPPDTSPPAVTITTPPVDAIYAQGEIVAADYACADEAGGSGLASCIGSAALGAPIDTATPGEWTFTVTATDRAGNAAVVPRRYQVLAAPAPPAAAVTPPPPPVAARLRYAHRARERWTVLRKLVLRSIPAGATVDVRCSGRGCPARRWVRPAAGTLSLRPFAKRRLRVGLVLEIRVTQPGAVGQVFILKIRSGRAPLVQQRCLPIGATRPTRCS